LHSIRNDQFPPRFSSNEAGAIAATAQHELSNSFPKQGWVEHDPMEILTSPARLRG